MEQETREAWRYHWGVSYLACDPHKSAEDVEKPVFHELHGYVGLNKSYGKTIVARRTV
jgi:hypothetical protein